MALVLRDPFFYMAGIGFLGLAKVKNLLKGYSSPKPFSFSQMQRCIDYDINVVEGWLTYLKSYCRNIESLNGKNVLELGPGSDLGTGLYLLAKGCSQYNACDVNDLVKLTPNDFYVNFFKKLEELDSEIDTALLKESLNASQTGHSSKLNFQVRDDFDLISTFGEEKMDIVFSQAAFEHFDDIEGTIAQLSKVCRSGATMIVQVDLKAHSRWIREKDPNNIYRYPAWLYRLFSFRGSPNRVRPYQYKQALSDYGWVDIEIHPLKELNNSNNPYSGMNQVFVDDKNQMEYLSIMICARKP